MSEASPESVTTPETGGQASEESSGTPDPSALAAEVEKWKALSQKNEQRAKANAEAAKEFEKFRQASMTEQERAVEAARGEATSEATLKYVGRLVDAEVRAAASGRLEAEQVKALLEGLDRTRFLTEDGDVDQKAVAAWVGLLAPATSSAPPDLGQGARGVAASGVDMTQLIRKAAGRA